MRQGFPGGASDKASACQCRRPGFHPWIGKTAWRREWWLPTPVFLPGEFHGQRSLVGYSPWGHEESDMTEWLHFHFLLSCTGEGNGNPLQCSCLENPIDGRAWWAAVYGVAQSQTWLKWLSSSSSSKLWDALSQYTELGDDPSTAPAGNWRVSICIGS